MVSTPSITSSHPYFNLVGNAKLLKDSTEQLRTNVFSQSGINQSKVESFGDMHSQAVQFGGEISADLGKMLTHLNTIIKLKGDEKPAELEEPVHAVKRLWDVIVDRIEKHKIDGVDDLKSLVFKDGYKRLLQQQTERIGHFMRAAKKLINTGEESAIVNKPHAEGTSAKFKMPPIRTVPLLLSLAGAGSAYAGGHYVLNTDCPSNDHSTVCEVKRTVTELMHAVTHSHNEDQ